MGQGRLPESLGTPPANWQPHFVLHARFCLSLPKGLGWKGTWRLTLCSHSKDKCVSKDLQRNIGPVGEKRFSPLNPFLYRSSLISQIHRKHWPMPRCCPGCRRQWAVPALAQQMLQPYTNFLIKTKHPTTKATWFFCPGKRQYFILKN